MSAEREATLKALNEVHRFPGPFIFKIIGENSADFMARVVQAVVTVLGPKVYPKVTTRESAQGNHQSITLSVYVPDAEAVLDVYAALSALTGVRYLL